MYKLAVYVPESHSEEVREALSRAGAGWLGNYSDCTFMVKGIGTFRPLEGSNPFSGEPGNLSRVSEVRLETIIPEELQDKVIKAMLQAHPYEEVAYDLYPLINQGDTKGLGRVGYLPAAMTLGEFILLIRERLGLQALRYCGELERRVYKVALCGGSGASLLSEAVRTGADVFLTGDVKYHEAQEALTQNMAIVDAGHYATEYPVVPVVVEYLRSMLEIDKVEVKGSTINTDPFRYWQG